MGKIKVEEAFIEKIIEGFLDTMTIAITTALENQTKLVAAQNEALVRELKAALYPKNDVPLSLSRLHPDLMEARWQVDQGLITSEQFAAVEQEFMSEAEVS